MSDELTPISVTSSSTLPSWWTQTATAFEPFGDDFDIQVPAG